MRAGRAIAQFLDYIERDVSFNSLDPDCIDRIIAPDVDFPIPLGWDNLRHRLLATFNVPPRSEGLTTQMKMLSL